MHSNSHESLDNYINYKLTKDVSFSLNNGIIGDSLSLNKDMIKNNGNINLLTMDNGKVKIISNSEKNTKSLLFVNIISKKQILITNNNLNNLSNNYENIINSVDKVSNNVDSINNNVNHLNTEFNNIDNKFNYNIENINNKLNELNKNYKFKSSNEYIKINNKEDEYTFNFDEKKVGLVFSASKYFNSTKQIKVFPYKKIIKKNLYFEFL